MTLHHNQAGKKRPKDAFLIWLARVSDPSIDPESPYDSAAVAPDDGGDPKVVDRWLFRRALLALEILWRGSCGPLRQSSTDTSAGQMEGTSSRLGSCAWVCGGAITGLTAFNDRPHHKQWVWPPRSHANKSLPRTAVENHLLAVANTCATATAPRLKMLKTRQLETT